MVAAQIFFCKDAKLCSGLNRCLGLKQANSRFEALRPAWLTLRPDWLGLRPALLALRRSRGGMDGWMDGWTDGRMDRWTKKWLMEVYE